jgi:hypothetical protein
MLAMSAGVKGSNPQQWESIFQRFFSHYHELWAGVGKREMKKKIEM